MKLLDIIAEHFIEEAKHPYEYLSADAQEVAKHIMAGLNIPKEEIKGDTKNRIIILSDRPRAEIFADLEKLGYKRYEGRKYIKSSGGGYVAPNGVQIIHKPLELSKQGGAGISNETIVVEHIQQALDQVSPLTVIFKGKNKDLTYKNVTGVTHIGKEGESKGWKGDIALQTKDGSKHISIKKDGGYRWESVVRRFRTTYEAFMNKAIAGEIPNLKLVPAKDNPRLLLMMSPSGKPYGRIFIKGHPELEPGSDTIYQMAFGPDHADIVQRTFSKGDFNLKGNVLTINSSKVMEDMKDFNEEDFPVIEFERNASKATRLDGIYQRGILMRTRPAGQAKGSSRANYLYVDYKDIM
jgi:hypothetical protein